MENNTLFNESNQATYCPEDDKLRLYIGRVPRDEYEALRKEGWTSTPKQDCDFVAVWTPDREDTALSYAGFIGDEDQDPGERAAERAERFSGYLGKRMAEATGHADKFEAGPSSFGFQSQERADRAAARHERIADKAVTQWSKAEYWQQRTQGVIAHALYKDLPGVRMGRIKTIEADCRKNVADRQKSHTERTIQHSVFLAIVEHAEGKREKLVTFPGYQYTLSYIRKADNSPEDAPFTPAQLRRVMACAALSGYYSDKWRDLRNKTEKGEISGEDCAREWLNSYGWEAPGEFVEDNSRWYCHYQLRLAYENQMLEAQGGRAGVIDMIPGGWLRGGRRLGSEERQIVKVNKSPKTGRVVSVVVRDNHASTVNHWGNPFPDGIAKVLSHVVEVERMSPDSYRAPTQEELEAFHASEKAAKKARKESTPAEPPLINLSLEDAQKLQGLWNKNARAERGAYTKDYPDSEILPITQAQYSEASKGTYASAKAQFVTAEGVLYHKSIYGKENGTPVFKVRYAGAKEYGQAKRVIVLTDKPTKPLPITLNAEVAA